MSGRPLNLPLKALEHPITGLPLFSLKYYPIGELTEPLVESFRGFSVLSANVLALTGFK